MRLYLPSGKLKNPGAEFADLTTAKQTDDPYWSTDEPDVLVIPFDTEPTTAEQDAIARRLTTAPGVEGTLHTRVTAAYDQLLAFENTTTPTSAQTVAAVKLLCKVARGLIRLRMRQYDKAD